MFLSCEQISHEALNKYNVKCAMNLEERKFELENEKFNLEKKRFKFNKIKFSLTILTVLVTLGSAIFGLFKYFEEKKKEHDSAYRNTISRILTGDVDTQKAALLETSKYEEKYAEFIPLLIDLMVINHKNNNRSLDRSLIMAYIVIGKRMSEALVETNHYAQDVFELNLLNSSGWAICEILKNVVGRKYSINLDGISLRNCQLDNLTISKLSLRSAAIDSLSFINTIFFESDLSNTIFKNCNFWNARFSNNVNLDGAEFIECILEECKFDSDTTKTRFITGFMMQ